MKESHRATNVVALLLVLLLAVGHPHLVSAQEGSSTIDPKADEVVRKLSEYLLGLKSFAVDLEAAVSVQAEGMKHESETAYSFAVERPKKLSLVLRKGAGGATLVCDGTKVYTYLPAVKAYTVEEAPDNVSALAQEQMLSMLFVGELIGADPYKSIVEGVKSAESVASEDIDRVRCHHLKFTQEEFDWELWVEEGPTPVARKVASDMSRVVAAQAPPGMSPKDVKATVTLTFQNWVTDGALPEGAFVFTPPEGAKEVESFAEAFAAQMGEEEPHPLVGKPAPDFKLQLLEGGQMELSAHKGSDVVVLDFWATWCPPCRRGLPALAEVTGSYKDKGVVFYAVNEGEDAETIRKFLKEMGLEVVVALDRDGSVGNLYGVTGIPQTVIIDKNGVVQRVHLGLAPDLERRLKEELEAVLAGK